MQGQDRRRAPRRRKLLRLEFEHDSKRITCVSTDVNGFGAFVNAQVVPPVGSRFEMQYQASKASGDVILLRVRVVRVVHQTLRASRIPGMAVAFEELASVAGPRQLADFLKNVLGYADSAIGDGTFEKDSAGYPLFKVEQPALETDPAKAAMARERALPINEEQSQKVLDPLTNRRERRQNQRFPVFVEVSYYLGDIPYLGTVVNICQTSLFLRTDHDLPELGARLTLKYPLAEAPDPQYVRIDGTVCRHFDSETERFAGFAVHFDHVGELGRPGLFHTYLQSFRRGSKKPRRRGFHYSRRRR